MRSRRRRKWGRMADLSAKRAPFSLFFRGPRDLPLRQGTYTLTHEQMGIIKHLFIVPVDIDSQGRYYQALFS